VKSVRAWILRLVGVLASERSERDLSAVLESHLQLQIDDSIRAGVTLSMTREHSARLP
jgi:hypothetical protein